MEERKNFMNAKFGDPMRKRELWAVSLRKNKTREVIESKRKRNFMPTNSINPFS